MTTKLAGEIKDHNQAVAAINGSLETLGIGYIDLMLIHCPQPWADFRGGDYVHTFVHDRLFDRIRILSPCFCLLHSMKIPVPGDVTLRPGPSDS